jgi:hypothetical protein
MTERGRDAMEDALSGLCRQVVQVRVLPPAEPVKRWSQAVQGSTVRCIKQSSFVTAGRDREF